MNVDDFDCGFSAAPQAAGQLFHVLPFVSLLPSILCCISDEN
jgi:hypothetical protein